MTQEAGPPATSMPIDFHSHWIPKPLADELRARLHAPRLARTPDGGEIFDCGYLQLPMPSCFDDIDVRLAEMDRTGIGHAVLSLTTVYGIDSMALAESLPLCRSFNDAVAAVCSKYPERFSGLAALPSADLSAALVEFEG